MNIKYNGISEDDYLEMLIEEARTRRGADESYANHMMELNKQKQFLTAEEQLREQASFYENDCFNRFVK